MSKHGSNVRLFESDGYTFKLWLDPGDAQERRERGELEVATHPITGEEIGYKLRGPQKPSNREDPTSISYSEMLVNAGVPPKPQVNFIDPDHEKAVRLKVKVWPKCWDRKSAPSVSYA
jgi:hypothetical protein